MEQVLGDGVRIVCLCVCVCVCLLPSSMVGTLRILRGEARRGSEKIRNLVITNCDDTEQKAEAEYRVDPRATCQ